jgi:hypothetical protein
MFLQWQNLAEKQLSYNRANRAVAVLCNHQRAPPNTFGQSKANLQSKVKGPTDIWYRDKKWWYVVMSYFSSTFTSVCLLSSFNTSRLSAGVSSRHWPRVNWSCPRRSKLTAQTASCRHEWPLLVADRRNIIAHKGKTISWLNTPFCVCV